MYEHHWQLQSRPFDDTNDDRFFFAAAGHAEGLARLVYLIKQHRSGGCLIGAHGIGKTLLLRAAARSCDERSALIHLSPGPCGALDLTRRLCVRLGGPADAADLPGALRNIERACGGGIAQNVIIMIDAAQHLDGPAAFDALHLVAATLEAENRTPTLLLAGTDDLAARLPPDDAIGQRMQLTWRLSAFSLDETAGYVRHRLAAAGRREDIFDQAAHYLLFEHSGGIPRLINQLADLALMLGSRAGAQRVDHALMLRAVAEHHRAAPVPEKKAAAAEISAAKKAESKFETAAEAYVWE